MPEHDGDPVTAQRRRPHGRQPGRQAGRRRGRRGDQATQLIYAAGYLLNAPGTQQLLVWGGHQAGELVSHAAGLLVERDQLATAATAWHAMAGDLRQVAAELSITAAGSAGRTPAGPAARATAGPAGTAPGPAAGPLAGPSAEPARSAAGSVAGPAGWAAELAEWESPAAEAFHAGHRSRLDRLTALAGSYQAVGDTLAGAADQAGRVHAALLATTQAAGDAVRLLGDAMSSGGAARAVVTAWLAGGRGLLDAWAAHADQAAATLTALHSATLDPANPEPSTGPLGVNRVTAPAGTAPIRWRDE
jgi:hypothetical protein